MDRRGRIELSKFKLQNRYALTKLPLVRIDIDSPPHMNPDGTKTSRNHIHIYKDGYDEKFAYTLDSDEFKDLFPDPKDRCSLLKAYLEFIKVISVPQITEIHSF